MKPSISSFAAALVFGGAVGFAIGSYIELRALEAEYARVLQQLSNERGSYKYTLADVYEPATGRIDRSKRFVKESWDKTIGIWHASGASEVPINKLHATICAVIARVDFVPNDYNIARLVLETMQIESNCTHVTQLSGGPALGLIQMEPATYRDLTTFLKRHPSVHKQILSFYDNKSTLEENLAHNVPFQIALVLGQYWRRCGNLLSSFVESPESRWTVYKLVYNSVLGASDRARYIAASEWVAAALPPLH